ncbi:MAG: apolipoprotein N-acyltransferase [Candidatus Saganbacteria bacterium]|nr:apolipoprotein N-acyltransferase [Candidatus Saganbacteria bacterium]
MKRIILPILSGLMLALCFPKANLFFFAWIGLIPFFYAIKKCENLKLAALNGFILGVVFFSFNLAWLTTLADYVGGWAILGYICLVLFQSLYFAAAAVLIKIILNRFPSGSPITFPIIWTLFEWIRTLTPFGVAAGGLGYSQTPVLPLIQIASITSVYGVSFLIVFVNTLFLAAFENRKELKKSILILLLILILLSGLYFSGVAMMQNEGRKNSKPITISIIQGNIDQKTKLDSKALYSSFDKYEKLSLQAKKDKPDIIIWTETAVTTYLMNNPSLLKRIKELALSTNACLLIGTPYYKDYNKIYNSLAAFTPSGEFIGTYNKQHPVPFGEYLPFRKILHPFLKNLDLFDYDYNGDNNPSLLSVKGLKIGALICFESTFPQFARQRVRAGADILLTVTNDAWFKDSSALNRHLNMGIMRAVENRRYFIQAANTGISAVIDPYGRILEKTDINKAEVLTFQIP